MVEWFYDSFAESSRLHFDRLRRDAFPHGEGLGIQSGIDVEGQIINGGWLSTDTERERFTALLRLLGTADPRRRCPVQAAGPSDECRSETWFATGRSWPTPGSRVEHRRPAVEQWMLRRFHI